MYSILLNLKKHLNLSSILFFLKSIKSSLIDFLRSDKPFQTFKKRKNGISVLLATQNEEILVKLSILSFLDFADEIIVVDNGSIDKTKEIVKKLAIKYKKVKFFDKPEIASLQANRNFALKQSKYRWICRFDSDYVAYTEGKYDIKKLRNYLLKIPRGIIPKVVLLYSVNTGGDFWHVRVIDLVAKTKIGVYTGPEKRIYEFFPFFNFARFGRREYGAFQIFLKKIEVKTIHFMHCTIKSKINYFLRSERSNWREGGKFRKYPTLILYIKDVIKIKYYTDDIKEAIHIYLKEVIYNKDHYIEYDPIKHLPYPSLIKKEMENEMVYRNEKI